MEDSPVIAKCPNIVDPVVGQSDLNVHNPITQWTIPKGHKASRRIRFFVGIRLGQAVRYGLLLHGVRCNCSLSYKYRIFSWVYVLYCSILIDRILNLVFVVRTYLTLILCLQTFHRLTPNKGENILADLNLVCIGDEFADVLRVIFVGRLRWND